MYWRSLLNAALAIAMVIVKVVNCSPSVKNPASSWPRMRNYDIWGSPADNDHHQLPGDNRQRKSDQPEFTYRNLSIRGEKRSRNGKGKNYCKQWCGDQVQDQQRSIRIVSFLHIFSFRSCVCCGSRYARESCVILCLRYYVNEAGL